MKIIETPSDTFWVSAKENRTKIKLFLLLQKQIFWGKRKETQASWFTSKLTEGQIRPLSLLGNVIFSSKHLRNHFHRTSLPLSNLLLTCNLQKNDAYWSTVNTSHQGTTSQFDQTLQELQRRIEWGTRGNPLTIWSAPVFTTGLNHFPDWLHLMASSWGVSLHCCFYLVWNASPSLETEGYFLS